MRGMRKPLLSSCALALAGVVAAAACSKADSSTGEHSTVDEPDAAAAKLDGSAARLDSHVAPDAPVTVGDGPTTGDPPADAASSADAPAAFDAIAADAPTDGAAPVQGGQPIVYVAGFRAEIDVFRLDMTTSTLTKVGAVANPPMMPSFFAWDALGRFGYSVDEVVDGKLVSYSIDSHTGMLTRLNEATVMGFGPTYVSLDKTGKWALTASWAGGKAASIAVSPIAADGRVGPPVDRRMYKVDGWAHYITTDPTNRYAFASINGEEYVAQFKFDAATGKLTENTPARVMRPAGAGPRHMAFHPDGKHAYLINEHGNTVTVYGFDDGTGLLTQLQDISTLPAGYKGMSATAQILVHGSGKFVYGSNRGHDSVVIYAVDPGSGMLTLVGHKTGVGAFPRNFTIDPTGTLLLIAGQNDGSLTVFKIDQGTGMLAQVGKSIAVGMKPTYVGVVNVAGM